MFYNIEFIIFFSRQVQTSTLSGAPISQPGPMPSTSHSSQPTTNNNINIAYDTRLNMARASAAAAAAAVPTRQMHQVYYYVLTVFKNLTYTSEVE